jgi:hypothetical protein
MLISLTKAQADAARSKPSPYAAIEPVLLTDGSYILGVEVISDPAHVLKKAALQACPQVTEASVAGKIPGTGAKGAAGSK